VLNGAGEDVQELVSDDAAKNAADKHIGATIVASHQGVPDSSDDPVTIDFSEGLYRAIHNARFAVHAESTMNRRRPGIEPARTRELHNREIMKGFTRRF
jgi:hypothetical protein